LSNAFSTRRCFQRIFRVVRRPRKCSVHWGIRILLCLIEEPYVWDFLKYFAICEALME
jgi:hypothetical protein